MYHGKRGNLNAGHLNVLVPVSTAPLYANVSPQQLKAQETLPLKTFLENTMIFKRYLAKKKTTSLPPHHCWDWAIDLLPNVMPPKNRVYPLSLPENQAMENYIEKAARYIEFFFVDEKDGALCPYIDY